MSKFLSAAAKQEFDDEVHHEFQSNMAGGLRETVTVRTGVIGNDHKFRKMGKGQAHERTAPSQDVVPMDVSHTLIPCPLSDWEAPEFTDIFNQAEVNFDERRELSFTIAMAMGRRLDQLIIDAMNASTSTAGSVDTNVGGANTDLNVAKARRAKRFLDDQGVFSSDRHIAVSALGLEAMLGETEVTSSDFNSVKALVQGELDTFLGFKWHTIETRLEGGLPKAATLRTNFAWHKAGLGLAIGIDITTEVNYIAVKTSWLSTGLFKAGACVRDTDGFVDITTTEP